VARRHLALPDRLVVLGPLIGLWQRGMGLPGADAFGKVSPTLLLPTVVILAPVAEECIFRGWLSGARARWCCSAGCWQRQARCGRSAMARPIRWPGWCWCWRCWARPVAGSRCGGGHARLVRRRFRRCSCTRWSSRCFTWQLSAHHALALVPMVLPQLWAGLVFGFIRVRIGLPAAMLAHALGNLVAVTAALLMR
jgi:hypothetical protein